jgi:hypothetical protein
MQTTYRLNTQELNAGFIESLQRLLPNQDIEITVSTLPKLVNVSERDWLQAVSTNPSFDFLHDEAENIYLLTDGTLIEHEK